MWKLKGGIPMTQERVKRKISAIFSADVEGYSRLMGDDEVATVRTLENYRAVMADLITQHRGRVVDSPGDNLLAEFGSVVDAVQCAVEVQQVLKAKNAELPETRRMQFRIGVNLGDVIEEGDRIYGDGVNIAARMEGLAEGGGICVSGSAYEQIENKLALGYEYLGEHTVKNIAKPVRVYKVPMELGARKEKRSGIRQWKKVTVAVAAVIIIAAGAFTIWNFYFRPPPMEPASAEKMAYPLPDKPSIAVLPSNNLSGDTGKTYFEDGLEEKKVSPPSKIPEMVVNARKSSPAYEGESVRIRQVSEETLKKEAAEIAQLEKELAAMDTKITAMKKDFGTTKLGEGDDLLAMLAMVEEREKQQQRLDELRKKRQQDERQRQAEMARLKKEKEEKWRQAIEKDIGVYEKIVSSSYGKDLKETAWKKLVANYPEAADLAPGKVDVLKILLFKKWVELTTGMEFVLVEGGCFQMGNTLGDGDNDEEPVHEVCVDSFGMSRYEVTQGQWQKIMGNNPSRFTKGNNYPVEKVSWDDTQAFICKLNSHTGRSFRLPTEAEWEYAARSGGKKEKYAGGSDVDRLGWYDGNSGGSTHPVGTKEPNDLGLYDMSGNVWEWSSDWYGENYYQQSPRNNPQGPSSGSFRVIRDGCWNGSPWLARSANRDRFRPGYRLDNLGFRLVLPCK
jgi:formylglycine-generating enzyme required for sulfatase activity/class 3 adenylate cyclase